MAVICFVDGGSTKVARFAAQQLLRYPERNADRIGSVTCYRDSEGFEAGTLPGLATAALTARELIAAVRELQGSHDHVVLDAAGTSDQTIALAVALSDVALTPLCVDEPDQASFAHALDLVRIVAENLRRPEKHGVFLTTRSRAVTAGTLVKVSGLLAMKNLVTLPVPLCGWDHEASRASDNSDNGLRADHTAFAYSVFDLVDRQFTPIVRQRRFG